MTPFPAGDPRSPDDDPRSAPPEAGAVVDHDDPGRRSYTSFAGLFIVVYHAGLLIGLPLYFYHVTPRWSMVAASAALVFLTGIGITASYHRLYSHRGYSLNRMVEAVLLFLGTAALQGSVLQWAHDHRRHHAYVDTDRDPYSIKKGFWYAHVLWLFDDNPPMDRTRVADLARNPLVAFQHRYYGSLAIGSNLLVFVVVGWLLDDFLGAFVLAWWTRLLVSHHLTWFINSLAHTWGARTYSREHTAVDNYLLAFLTVGEGYHNYHHTFASDYRNGFRWYHFDPAKWLIWTLSKLGLASDLTRYSSCAVRKKLLLEDRNRLLESLRRQTRETGRELELRITQLAETIRDKLTRQQRLAEELRLLEPGAVKTTVREELKRIKTGLRRDWRSWGRLYGAVLASEGGGGY